MLFAVWKTGAICHTRRKIKRHAAGYNAVAGRHSHDLSVDSDNDDQSVVDWRDSKYPALICVFQSFESRSLITLKLPSTFNVMHYS